MSRTRAEANQALYLARILLGAWDQARESGQPEAQLLGAFLPAVRLHLGQAYGWFLLSVSGVSEASGAALPRSTAALAPPEPGRSPAPELRELAQLEQSGWIADMLADASPSPGPASSPPLLLGSDRQQPGYAVAAAWAAALEDMMLRMDDSLAEC